MDIPWNLLEKSEYFQKIIVRVTHIRREITKYLLWLNNVHPKLHKINLKKWFFIFLVLFLICLLVVSTRLLDLNRSWGVQWKCDLEVPQLTSFQQRLIPNSLKQAMGLNITMDLVLFIPFVNSIRTRLINYS